MDSFMYLNVNLSLSYSFKLFINVSCLVCDAMRCDGIVFMWVPSLILVNKGSLPTGLVFSSFMLSMSLGGMLFSLLLPVFPGGAEGLCTLIYLVAALAMLVPVYFFDFWSVFVAFLVLEAMVGMFNSCGGMLRSRYYPEQIQSSVMSVFRLPLNLLVVLGTSLANRAHDESALKSVFLVIVGMHGLAMLLQLILTVLYSVEHVSNDAASTVEGKSKRE